ncbi:hypothetical protein [Blautia glucerasea]|uniref:hypothetical protein n=1 Tax=Blautia glucerasea TaxID=536633 RepID=UPI001FC7E497|nr:hypothetical protein [Blautia glucerasea]
MDEKEIRKILKEETVIPDNIDRAMEDVLKGILDSPDERMSSTKKLIVKSDKGRSKNSGNKKKIIRILLPVAAILGVSTGVLATKLGWLHKELEQQGVTEQEAVQMVVTEPDSNAENVEDVTSYHITPKEKDWNQSMLSVTEAYFDGSGLSFLGEPSREAKNYTISCRDHATVNGEDALAALNKIDGEDLYYGHITLYDDALTEKILKEDSQVELSMTIQAYPDYNGKIYYTWKDDEAYRKIFKTGSFTDSEGMLAYALPAEDAYRGYTPQTLTVTLPLNDEVRDIIEKYRKEGKLQAEDTGVEPISDSLDENTQETTDSEDPSDAAEANEKYDPETAVLQVKESHVTASLPGKSGTLTIEADITGSTTDVSKGILEKYSVSEEEICSWFGGGDGWEKSKTDKMVWENKEKGLQIFISDGRIQCDGLSEKNLGDLGNNTEEEKLNIINQLLSRANLTGTSVKKSISNMTEGYDYYDTEILLNGIPAGGLSQHGYLGKAGFGPEPGDCYFNIPFPLQVKEEEAVTLLSMEEIMKSVEQYVKEGKIGLFTEQDTAEEAESTTIPVTKICLEYYIDETAEGITYRSVWSFRCPYQWKDSPDEQELFYIDGETGALIRDAFGW